MTTIVTWETWSAAEAAWKDAHPFDVRGKGWRQRMLSEQFGGAKRPTPPHTADPYPESICQGCGREGYYFSEFNADPRNPDGSWQIDTGGPVGPDGLEAGILYPGDYYELCPECVERYPNGLS